MRKLLPTFLLTILTFRVYPQTQTYEDVAIKCTAAFQDGLINIPTDSIDKVLMKRLDNLRECFIGLRFPDFNMTSIDGTQYKLSDLRGKVIMLNFWFIECAPCVSEMPLLNQLTEEYHEQDFILLTFSTNDKESISNFKKKHELNYAIFEKSKSTIENTFHLSFGYPTNIFLDKEGKIVEFKMGSAVDEEKLRLTKATFKEIIDTELKR